MTPEQLAEYDVVWDTPSENASGSMPIGNGDLAANVWVEPNGDLLLLVSKSDAWDENSTLCKLGRVRIRCDPPLQGTNRFRQCLTLADATITVDIDGVTFRIWADANSPAIRISVTSGGRTIVEAALETWRNYPYIMKPTQTGDMFKNLTGKDPYPTPVTPDQVDAGSSGDLYVWHENTERYDDPVAINLKLQGLADYTIEPPLTGRVFGMVIVGNGFNCAKLKTIRSVSAQQHNLNIYGLTQVSSNSQKWRAALQQLVDEDEYDPLRVWNKLDRHAKWWRDFWARSHLRITSVADIQNAFNVTQAYVLQRYMNASAGRGAFPIKHNGSLFTVGRPWDPDFRRWGGPGFWFMNQRLIYWPMLADGDFDLMRPWLDMYRRTLPLQKHRTEKYFGHGGAHYPETMTFWGAEVSGHYGWTPFEEREQPEAECAYLTYYWSGAIELILILCEYVDYTDDVELANSHLEPIADAVLEFYEKHYPRDGAGKLRFEPAQALETWHWAINPMPEIAGLHYVLRRILALETGHVPPSLPERAERMLAQLPSLPRGQRDGEEVLLPAAEVDKKKNTENPELYCIFPYRLFGVGKPELDLARRTFARRLHVEDTCWHQDAIQMALLGLTDEAKDFVSRRALPANHSDSRFPAFWNAFHDWIPDIDNGGVLQLAVQSMIVQCDGPTIRLLPVWPTEWDLDFKLHVPGPAVIEGTVRQGQLKTFKIDPPERLADVLWNERPLALANGNVTA